MRHRILIAAAIAATTPLALSACSSGPSAPATSASASAHSAQDVAFASGMAMHHRQAVEMSDVLLAKSGAEPDVVALAKRIKSEQQPEIDLMDGWLRGWGAEPVGSSAGGEASAMTGMMSAADMAALRKANGAAASTLYLRQMIEHHEGALTMAQQEIAHGTDRRAIALAKRIVSSQRAEISRMREMLAAA